MSPQAPAAAALADAPLGEPERGAPVPAAAAPATAVGACAAPLGASADAPGASADAPGLLRMVWAILSPAERRRLLLLQPLVVVTALLETAGVASIVPFLALLSDPTTVERHAVLRWAYHALGFASVERFFLAAGLAVLALVTVGNAVSALTTWALLRFAWMGNHHLGQRLLESYLARPYAFFLQHNSAELAKNILAEVHAVVAGILVALTHLSSRAVVLLGVLGALVAIDPLIALLAGGVFGGLYGAMFALIRRRLRRDGRLRSEANALRHKITAEALGGVKEIKLYGLERQVARAYAEPSRLFGDVNARTAALGQVPRYGLETIAFAGVLLIVLALLGRGQSLSAALPVLGLYAFAAYRMLPGLQAIFAGFTAMRCSLPALELIYRDLECDPRPDLDQPGHREGPAAAHRLAAVTFERSVELDGVSFTYPGAPRPVLEDVSLVIPRGHWIALVGPTGAGKSTLVDLLLGLLRPTRGCLRVDGVSIDDGRLASWQRLVAYVPQQIFLTDDTVARNIAFGIPSHEVDLDRVREVARTAQIADFIEQELPQGYDTPIGERGIRLSGGQRQRLGIARALYRSPLLLVLDEATSALDPATEARLLEALRSAHPAVTVVLISHRDWHVEGGARGGARCLRVAGRQVHDAPASAPDDASRRDSDHSRSARAAR